MILSGVYQKLMVGRVSDFGLYLTDDEENEVLLPNRYVSLENKVGDVIEVFVYHDSEDRLVATTERPYVTVGEVASLRVVDKTVHGAFLDWGLTAKDIFLPNRNMIGRVEGERSYVVYVYRDNITGRAVATMALKSFISNNELSLERGQDVDIIIVTQTPTGYRAVVDNRHWGVLYSNQLFAPVAVGDRLKAYVRKITEDNRVDLSLQQEGYDEVKASADKLLGIIQDAGGWLGIHDGSSPEEVVEATRMSKKVFKRTAGYLMKRGSIVMNEEGIKLIGEGVQPPPMETEKPNINAPEVKKRPARSETYKPAGRNPEHPVHHKPVKRESRPGEKIPSHKKPASNEAIGQFMKDKRDRNKR